MKRWPKDKLLASLLWGSVAGVGQYTMLFLTIIRRIHVRFVNNAPVFYVEPQGLIPLTKDTALASVWLLTVLYGLLVTFVTYSRPQPHRGGWIALGVTATALAITTALAEPLWGLIILADLAVLYPILATRHVDRSP